MLKKCLIALFAVIAVSALYAAPKQIKIAQGAACYVWNKNVVNKPEGVPAGGFVDTETGFRLGTLRHHDGLGQLANTCCFIMWEGFVKIPRTDDYRFTLISDDYVNTRIFINGKTLITRRSKEQETVTASASLKKGMAKIRIYFNPAVPNHVASKQIVLKFGRATGMKMTDITPANMYHQVEDEEE